MFCLDQVVHFEIPADNIERASKFYKSAFNWMITPVPQMEYTLLGTVEVDQNNMPKQLGAINGGMMERTPQFKSPIITISVQDIDVSLKRIQTLGGKIIQGKMEVPNTGYTAYFQDTEGNVMGLFQPTGWRQPK
jgi:uncharacterized protein